MLKRNDEPSVVIVIVKNCSASCSLARMIIIPLDFMLRSYLTERKLLYVANYNAL